MLKFKLQKPPKSVAVFLIIVFLLTTLCIPSFASASDESLIKQVVTNYYNIRYQALSNLEEKDISVFWKSLNNPDYEVEFAALSTDINHRKMQLIDLKIKKYDLKMDFTNFDIQSGKAEVKVVESCNFYQNASPDTCSKMRSEHDIKLENFNGKWLIKSDSSDDFTKKIIIGKVEEGKSAFQAETEILAASKEQVIQKKEESLSLKNDVQPYSIITPLSLHAYIPSYAVTYALYWTDPSHNRNPLWGNYDGNGGDCTNFISQCLTYGGIPFDTVGNPSYNQRWFWNSYSSYTPTWTGVVPFWDYAINDSGVGLVATSTTRAGTYTGDIIQLYSSNYGWHHSVFVNNAYTYNNYRFIFICCHTSDQRDVNIDNYTAETMRYLHINGWNN